MGVKSGGCRRWGLSFLGRVSEWLSECVCRVFLIFFKGWGGLVWLAQSAHRIRGGYIDNIFIFIGLWLNYWSSV